MRVKQTLQSRDDELRRASSYPAGSFAPRNMLHMEDEERTRAAMGLIPHLGVAHAGQTATEFRRDAKDRLRGTPVTDQLFPIPCEGRPKADASPDEIKAWNTFIKAVPPELRPKFMSLPFYWFDRFGALAA